VNHHYIVVIYYNILIITIYDNILIKLSTKQCFHDHQKSNFIGANNAIVWMSYNDAFFRNYFQEYWFLTLGFARNNSSILTTVEDGLNHNSLTSAEKKKTQYSCSFNNLFAATRYFCLPLWPHLAKLVHFYVL